LIRIQAPSRLHFGLLTLPTLCYPTVPARHFGGVGLMVDHPGIELTVAPAADWSSHGPCAVRALTFARTACEALHVRQAFEVNVLRCPPEHVGLGTGTQLGLAAAHAIALASGRDDVSIPDLAKQIGRGRRSALGTHGFAQGGFLVEAGKHDAKAIAPLVARLPFPEDWSVLLVIPRRLQGDHGQREAEAFKHLAHLPQDLPRTDSLCRLVLLGMLPALIERDLDTFGAALHDFNRLVGEMFQPWQGDVYGDPLVGKLICALRGAGVKGVGQSSWGPTVFGVVPRGEAAGLSAWLIREHGVDREEVVVTSAKNSGAMRC
jgi:beta-ribofuranosylaminobenzene 5'-phosphate synthase